MAHRSGFAESVSSSYRLGEHFPKLGATVYARRIKDVIIISYALLLAEIGRAQGCGHHTP